MKEQIAGPVDTYSSGFLARFRIKTGDFLGYVIASTVRAFNLRFLLVFFEREKYDKFMLTIVTKIVISRHGILRT